MSKPLCGEPARCGMPSSPVTPVEAFSVVNEVPASVFSRGAATECSPGRKPGGSCRLQRGPGGKKDSEDSFAPGLRLCRKKTPGSRPGLHSVAAPRLFILYFGQLCLCKEGNQLSTQPSGYIVRKGRRRRTSLSSSSVFT